MLISLIKYLFIYIVSFMFKTFIFTKKNCFLIEFMAKNKGNNVNNHLIRSRDFNSTWPTIKWKTFSTFKSSVMLGFRFIF